MVLCANPGDCPADQECKEGQCVPIVEQDGSDGEPGCIDGDGDGFGQNCPAGPDCDDQLSSVNPSAPEICADNIDNDCDGTTDEDCGCKRGERIACYTGPAGTNSHLPCHGGVSICGADGKFGPCEGDQKPVDEVCDGVDNNCDGDTDEGLKNDCGACSPPNNQLVELCGNSLDDNCNGQVDENCSCDPRCQCTGQGAGQQCVCHPPTGQPCYSGPPNTMGFGVCRGGTHDCEARPDGSYTWSTCRNEVLPTPECQGGSNSRDDDCDGATDEGCLPDGDGDGTSPPADCDDSDPAVHPGASEICNGRDDDCDGVADNGVTNGCGGCGAPPAEVCDDGLDNDCDGNIDNGCGGGCTTSERQCYSGPPATADVLPCKWGKQTCDGEFWDACRGEVLPGVEVCNGVDDDCDGDTDERFAVGANACGYCNVTEICDGSDNDCDGLTDEGLRNACGDCLPVGEEALCDGQDDDCDGLVDEGLLNACGTCGDSCYEQDWGGANDWQFGVSDGVSNQANPDELRLDSTTQSAHFIWIAGTVTACGAASGCTTNPACYPGETCHTVRKFDTRTNQLIGTYSSWGWSPSRTAVAIDNSVWVGNRGCSNNLSGCDPSNPKHGNAVHLDADGNLLCRANAIGNTSVAVRAVTLDKDGNAWLGSWDKAELYKYSGTEIEGTDPQTGTPLCKKLCTVSLVDGSGTSRAYGAAVDGNGYLWIATQGSGPLRKIDTQTCAIVMTVSPGYNTYGMAIDLANNPWYGCFNGSCACGAVKVDGQTGVVTCIGRTQAPTGGGQTRGIAVDRDGNVWVAEWSHNTISKYSPDGTHLGQWSVDTSGTAKGPLGMAIDFDNNIWSIDYTTGHASKFTSSGALLEVFHVGASPYTYSDMTGYQLRVVTLKHGTWTVDYDSGYTGAIWDSVEWQGSLAADDHIRIRARTAATEGALVGATWSGFFDANPAVPSPWQADLHGAVPPGRWIQVEVTLATDDEISPAFSGLRVHWQY